MRTILLFMVCVSAVSQSLPPVTQLSETAIGLTTVTGTNNPLGIRHQGLAAYWQLPDTNNIWIPESTTNGGITWTLCGNQCSGERGWHFTETGTNEVCIEQWLVRIRNTGPIPPLRPVNAGIRFPPLPPPLPLRIKSVHQASFARASSLTGPALVLYPASVLDPDCDCNLFRVSFLAQTNHIYAFQRSYDLRSWELRPPEIDGDAGLNSFYDVFEGAAMYRIASREGVLPP